MSEPIEAAPAGGPSGKMLLIIGLALGVGLGGGGVYVMNSMAPPPAADGEAANEEPKEDIKPQPEDLKFETFERLAVPLHYKQRNGYTRLIGTYFMDVVVTTEDDAKKILVSRRKYDLRHRFNASITRGDVLVDGSTKELDVDKVRVLLLKEAQEVLGSDVVYSIAVDNLQLITH